MAHWAEIDENNIVLRVLVTDTNDQNGDEGYQWLVDNLGGTWIKTSYNTVDGVHIQGGTPLRKNFASIGYTYDEERDAFIAPKPEPVDLIYGTYDFVFDEEKCSWVPTPIKLVRISTE
jgi:hypothetical protein